MLLASIDDWLSELGDTLATIAMLLASSDD
jgi:hypothetical protein